MQIQCVAVKSSTVNFYKQFVHKQKKGILIHPHALNSDNPLVRQGRLQEYKIQCSLYKLYKCNLVLFVSMLSYSCDPMLQRTCWELSCYSIHVPLGTNCTDIVFQRSVSEFSSLSSGGVCSGTDRKNCS